MCCIAARFEREMKALMYQAYITDALKCVVLNTAGGDKRVTIEARYIDSVQKTRKPKDNRTREEIISGITSKIAEFNGGGAA